MRSKCVILVLGVGAHLVSCGGSDSHNSQVVESESYLESDPYIGDWKRDCSVVDEYWILHQLSDIVLNEPIYHEVYLSISISALTFSIFFYDDQSCTQPSFLDSSGWFINEGGDIVDKVNFTTSESYLISSYVVPLQYFGDDILFPLYSVDDRLYVVNVDTELLPTYPNNADIFQVDFNNYYQRR